MGLPAPKQGKVVYPKASVSILKKFPKIPKPVKKNDIVGKISLGKVESTVAKLTKPRKTPKVVSSVKSSLVQKPAPQKVVVKKEAKPQIPPPKPNVKDAKAPVVK